MCEGNCNKITISLDEYKELLITKGKYEELKSQYQLEIPLYDCSEKEYIKPEITE